VLYDLSNREPRQQTGNQHRYRCQSADDRRDRLRWQGRQQASHLFGAQPGYGRRHRLLDVTGCQRRRKVDAQLAASLAEAVQSVGRRTQSIQLLRDGLYRACEAYLNGAITANEYRLLLSRISAFAITLVAVDG
jgi:hypothetical protein